MGLSIVLFCAGLIIGSFLNVLIYRIPRGQGVVVGRSECPHCGTPLSWHDLMPVLSYVLLRGRCRRCRQRISWRYPLVELISAVFFVTAPSVVALVLLEIFLVLALIDLEHLLIPDRFIVLLALAGVGIAASRGALASHLGAGAVAAGLFFALWLISKGQWIGFGDVKLAGALGLIFGFFGTLVVLYLGVILGGVVGMALLATKRAGLKTQVPFGTFLAVGAMAYLFFQPQFLTLLARYSML